MVSWSFIKKLVIINFVLVLLACSNGGAGKLTGTNPKDLDAEVLSVANKEVEKKDCKGTDSGKAVVDECGVCEGPGKITWYKDADKDGFGDPESNKKSCKKPDDTDDYVKDSSDLCPDNSFLQKPGNKWYEDKDKDGVGDNNVEPINSCTPKSAETFTLNKVDYFLTNTDSCPNNIVLQEAIDSSCSKPEPKPEPVVISVDDDMYELGITHTGVSRYTGPDLNSAKLSIDSIEELEADDTDPYTFRSNLHVDANGVASVIYNGGNTHHLYMLSINAIDNLDANINYSFTQMSKNSTILDYRPLASISTVPLAEGGAVRMNVVNKALNGSNIEMAHHVSPISDGYGNVLIVSKSATLSKRVPNSLSDQKWAIDFRARINSHSLEAHHTPVIFKESVGDSKFILIPLIDTNTNELKVVSVELTPDCEQTNCADNVLSIISTQTIAHTFPDLSNGAYSHSSSAPVRMFLDGDRFYITMPVEASTKPRVVVGIVDNNGALAPLSSFDMEQGEEIIAVRSSNILTLYRDRSINCINKDLLRIRDSFGNNIKENPFTVDSTEDYKNAVILGVAVDLNGAVYVASLERKGCTTPTWTAPFLYKANMSLHTVVKSVKLIITSYKDFYFNGEVKITNSSDSIHDIFLPKDYVNGTDPVLIHDHINKDRANSRNSFASRTSFVRPVIYKDVFIVPLGHGILRVK